MTVNRTMLAAQIAGMFVVFALALFLAAGTAAWPAGWAYMARVKYHFIPYVW